MTVAQAVMEKLQRLPEDRQRRVLEFVESLQGRPNCAPVVDPEGILADERIDLPLDEFLRARREMWGGASDPETK